MGSLPLAGSVTHDSYMTGKKKLWLILGAVAVLAGMILYLALPRLVGNAIVSQAEKAGLKNLRLRVLHVGLGRLDLADLTLGDASSPALRIRWASVAYTPVGLLGKKIRGIRLSGVMVRVENRGQGFRFPGWDGPGKTAGNGGAMPAIGRLDLIDGRMLLGLGDRELGIPFAVHGSAIPSGYVLHAGLHPMGIGIHLLGTFDRKFSSGSVEFSAPAADLGSLARLAGQAVAVGGRVALYGEIRFKGGRFDRADIKADGSGTMALTVPHQGELKLDSLRLAFGIDGTFVPRDIAAKARGRRLRFGGIGIDSPFDLDIRGRRWPELEFDLRGLRLPRPLPLSAERIKGKLAGSWEKLKVDGDYRVLAAAGASLAPGLPWVIGRPYAITGSFQGGRSDGKIAWTLKAGGNGGIVLTAGSDSMGGRLKLDASLNGDSRRLRATLSGRLSAADMKMAGSHVKAGELASSAELTFAFGGDWRARGLAHIRDGHVAMTAGDSVQASGINVSLPWSYPGAGGPEKKGSFSVARLQSGEMRGRDIGGILAQEERGFAFSGLVHTGLPEVALSFKGSYALQASGGRLQADFLVPQAVLPAGTPLHALHPVLRGMKGDGRFRAQGKVWAANGRVGGSAGIEIVDADLDHAGEGIVLRGLQTKIRLDSLFDLLTAPAQRIRFKELRWQGNTLRDGEVTFRGEGGGRLFIESGRFQWNSGTITLDPLRLDPGGAWPQVTFRCRNVDLAEVLNALAGSEIVSSDARLSGVIPLKMINGSPVFLDGYLDTAAGGEGWLRVSKPEDISGGQVLVEEAIRDFRFKSIKVRLGSRNDRLNMVVSIDGAPARKLPLRYDQKRKDFIRDPSGRRHVELKGLLLDIRFDDIDLKDLLETGGQVTAGHREK